MFPVLFSHRTVTRYSYLGMNSRLIVATTFGMFKVWGSRPKSSELTFSTPNVVHTPMKTIYLLFITYTYTNYSFQWHTHKYSTLFI